MFRITSSIFALLLGATVAYAQPAPPVGIVVGTPVIGTCTTGYNIFNNSGKVGCQANSSLSSANPSATIGLTAVNGTANGAYMPADAAPPLSQSIAPTWTGIHTFSPTAAASPTALTWSAQSVAAGTSNTAGVNWAFNASQGTGTGVGGGFNFRYAAASTTGSSQNALASVLDFGVTTAGLWTMAGGLTLSSGRIIVPQAGKGAPSLAFAGSTGTGLFFANNIMNWTTGGTVGGALLDVGVWLKSGATYGWLNSATDTSGTLDANISRVSAGLLQIGTTAANALGSLNLTNITQTGTHTIPGAGTAAFISTATFTSGAGASIGTLTNAPSAGNPTTWIKITDNGVTRYIPAW